MRLTHWSLAAVVLYCSWQDSGDRLHRWVGYVGFGAVVLRLAWSLVARGAARLAHLKPSLRETLAWLQAGAPRRAAHDPLGLWMVWLLWALVALLALTGWMSRLDAFWGDERVTDVHGWLALALQASVVVHLLGVAAMSWHWRENLPRAMVDGRKRDELPAQRRQP